MRKLLLPKSDKGYNIVFILKDVDLTGYAAKFKLWTKGTPAVLVINGTCTITDLGLPAVCYYTLGATDLATVGKYKAEIERTKTGVISSSLTFDAEIYESG